MNTQRENTLRICDLKLAAVALQPTRRRILELSRGGITVGRLALQMGVSPQNVNYHAGKLLSAGLLKVAREHKSRNLIERTLEPTYAQIEFSPELLPCDIAAPVGEIPPQVTPEVHERLSRANAKICAFCADEKGGSVRFEDIWQRFIPDNETAAMAFARDLKVLLETLASKHGRSAPPTQGEGTMLVGVSLITKEQGASDA